MKTFQWHKPCIFPSSHSVILENEQFRLIFWNHYLSTPSCFSIKHTHQPPSGASVESLTAHSTDSESNVHEEIELRTDRDVEDLSKQLEKER